MVHFTVSLPDDLRRDADAKAASDGYANVVDYLRDLIVRDLIAHYPEQQHLQALWNEGVQSAVLDDEPEDVLEQIIAEIPARDEAA